GRILHHLKRHIDDPRCAVVLVSYQAPGTPGRRLLERGPTVRFLNRDWNKWAEVVHLDGFSGHADQEDLKSYLGPLVGRARAVRLAAAVREMGFADVVLPDAGEFVPIG